LILGVFSGLTRAIPVIGPIVSGLVIVLLGLAKAPVVGLYLLGFFAALHFVESKFIMPYLIGERMKLHPAVVIIVLLIGAEFFGIFGMFMAAPVAAILRVLIRHYLIKPKNTHVWGLPTPIQDFNRETSQSKESETYTAS
ncbi:MAG: AI-2E family transporter, partial [Armatimonadetes bacterium]|nr:AI-2E family transporter [Armatimonadota bacterium]